MPNWNKRVTRLITARYWAALLLIGLFVTATYILFQEAIQRERGGFEFVRLAAEQRVSSQRICFLAHALVDATDEEDRQYYRSTLRRAIRNMEQRHRVLSLENRPERVPAKMRAILQDIYFNEGQPFNRQVDSFLLNAQKVADRPQNELSEDLPEMLNVNYAGSRLLMQTHKMIFGLLRKEAKGAVDRVLTMGTVIWILTLVLLAVEVPLIFRPMVRRAQRSLSLMEGARRKAQRDAAAAETAREGQASFIRTMSHELRTPLNAILGMTQLMKMTGLPRKQDEYAGDILQAGQHLLDLIDDILEFSRLEASQVMIENAPASLREELNRTVSLLRPLATQKGLDLDYRLDSRLAQTYWADGPRIRQILVNLTGNAIKFTQSGFVHVRAVYAAHAGTGADLVRFEVEDSGIGVPESMQAMIFKEFQQADNSLTRKYGGSGLGLAISSRLVRLMKGNIGVESADGKGSLFWFTLPLERMAAPDRDKPGSLPRRNDPALSVLVAEYDGGYRKIIEKHLWGMGYQVLSANNGPDVLSAVMEMMPQAVLIDIDMPGPDGLSAIRAIRALSDPGATVFVIAVTARTGAEIAAQVGKAGADMCMTKPLDFEVLGKRLSVLSGNWSRLTAEAR